MNMMLLLIDSLFKAWEDLALLLKAKTTMERNLKHEEGWFAGSEISMTVRK